MLKRGCYFPHHRVHYFVTLKRQKRQLRNLRSFLHWVRNGHHLRNVDESDDDDGVISKRYAKVLPKVSEIFELQVLPLQMRLDLYEGLDLKNKFLSGCLLIAQTEILFFRHEKNSRFKRNYKNQIFSRKKLRRS